MSPISFPGQIPEGLGGGVGNDPHDVCNAMGKRGRESCLEEESLHEMRKATNVTNVTGDETFHFVQPLINTSNLEVSQKYTLFIHTIIVRDGNEPVPHVLVLASVLLQAAPFRIISWPDQPTFA